MKEVYYIEKNGRRRKGKKIICATCKKQAVSRIRKGKIARYCSHKCAYIGKQKKIYIKCHTCNKTIFRKPSQLKNSKSGLYFCNRKCKEKAQTLKFGCKEIMPNHFGTAEGRELWKSLINNLKKPSCEDCGNEKRYLLMVHHRDGNKNNNAKKNFEVVCSNCHIKRHLKKTIDKWIYSTKALTPRKFLNIL